MVLAVVGWIAAALVAAALVGVLLFWRYRAREFTRRIADLQREIGVRECIERQLQASQSNLQMATEASGVGTWYWDLQTDQVSCSDQARKLFGFKESDRIYRSTDFLATIHPDDQDRLKAAIQTAFAEGGHYQVEYRALRPDSSVVWLSTSGRALRDHDNEVRRAAGITADVTDRKRLEESFYQAQKMEAVGRLAGGVAHDFNNMLGVISAYAELLKEEPSLPSSAISRVDEIMNATQRANALTRQLLSFSRKHSMVPTSLDLNAVVSGVRDMMQRLLGEDVQIVLDLGPRLPSINADRGQLEQVLLNFAANSRDAMPKGGRFELRTSIQLMPPESKRPGDAVVLEVIDTGCGMSSDVTKHIFEPFYTTKPVGQGTGLGLATVYGVVEQAQGIIKVESSLGVGTTFRIYFPAVSSAARVEQMPRPQVEKTKSANVLLVEDEPALRQVLRQFMEASGMHVIAAMTGTEALQILERGESVDVLLTDLVMPEMDGRTLAQFAREKRPGLHIIYMSGHNDDGLMQRDLLGDGLAYLQKPFSRAELVKAIGSVISPAA